MDSTPLDSIDVSSMVAIVKGKEFAKLRRDAGLSQSKLSRKLDVTIRSLTRWETDETPIPKMAELALRYVIEEKNRGKRV